MYKSAGIVIIGDEILSGKFAEENARFAIQQFAALGMTLRRVVIIPDDIDDIAATVAQFSKLFDIVLTSGGVGPTHDDLTMAGIAKAFATQVVVHPRLEAILRAHWGETMPAANIRLAEVPAGAELVGDVPGERAWPTVRMKNVYILPGVPNHFRAKFHTLRELFRCEPTIVIRAYIAQDEGVIAPLLSSLSEQFPQVKIGSYPRLEETEFRVIVTLENKERPILEAARVALVETLGVWLVRLESSDESS